MKNKTEEEFIALLGRFFTNYLPNTVNASPNTMTSYKCAFRLLFQYIRDNTGTKFEAITFEFLNFELLTDFFDWLITERGNSRTTRSEERR